MTDVNSDVWIATDDLVLGGVYVVRAQKFKVAIFNGKAMLGCDEQGNLAEEALWEDGPPFGNAIANRKIGRYIVPSPWNNDVIKALLDAAEHLYYDLRLYEHAVDQAQYFLNHHGKLERKAQVDNGDSG